MEKFGVLIIVLAILTGIVLVVLLVYFVLLFMGKTSIQIFRFGKKVAKQLGDEIDHRFPAPKISFVAMGQPASIELGRPPAERTRVMVELSEDSPGAVKIYKENLTTAIGRLFGREDIQIGDTVFDTKFVVQSNPPDLVHKMFEGENRQRMLSILLPLKDLAGVRFDLSRRFLFFSVDGYPRDLASINDLAELVRQLAAVVADIQIPAAEAIWITKTSSGAVGQCQVCGSEMKTNLVNCKRCATPHHRECWEYVEMCSTFGCREIRFTEVEG